MRGLIFALLTFILGGVIALGLEKVVSFLPNQIASVFTKVYTVGIHPLAICISICGILGLIIGYTIVSLFVKK